MSTPVKAARHVRGWTLRHTVTQLRAAAAAIGETLPHDASVSHRIMEFESGRGRPGPFYRDLFCAIYQATPDELGWDATDPRADDPPGTTSAARSAGTRRWTSTR